MANSFAFGAPHPSSSPTCKVTTADRQETRFSCLSLHALQLRPEPVLVVRLHAWRVGIHSRFQVQHRKLVDPFSFHSHSRRKNPLRLFMGSKVLSQPAKLLQYKKWRAVSRAPSVAWNAALEGPKTSSHALQPTFQFQEVPDVLPAGDQGSDSTYLEHQITE